ncbi:uncharacterized protein LOC130979297 [Arachis stenosperma]|uniref:uncharacterized protein LOC130979297 n=1 Tax=Arachis stenosperma TaxID=217475 RepID=UPI0025AC0494|nr:uncharacterized protein LOC130979297 [Arachis stenosperma]
MMWAAIICGLVFYKLIKRFFYDDDILDVEGSDHSSALFSVADRIQKLYGGNVYVGLRIPDADTSSRQSIDIVLVKKEEVVVISVKNYSGILTVNGDGTWACEKTSSHKVERHPDPVAEARKQASILESYLEQRGVALPEGYISCKVVLPNPKLCTIAASSLPSEVVTHDEWVQMKPGPKNMFSGWVKNPFRAGKKDMQESIQQNLNFVLSTAPIWDRLELKANKYVLGEFLEFKGKQEDLQALSQIRRSKVERITVQKTSMFGLAPSRLQVLYALRDYRTEGASEAEWKEVTVRSSTEIIFQLENSSKVRKFKLSSVISLTLSA